MFVIIGDRMPASWNDLRRWNEEFTLKYGQFQTFKKISALKRIFSKQKKNVIDHHGKMLLKNLLEGALYFKTHRALSSSDEEFVDEIIRGVKFVEENTGVRV